MIAGLFVLTPYALTWYFARKGFGFTCKYLYINPFNCSIYLADASLQIKSAPGCTLRADSIRIDVDFAKLVTKRASFLSLYCPSAHCSFINDLTYRTDSRAFFQTLVKNSSNVFRSFSLPYVTLFVNLPHGCLRCHYSVQISLAPEDANDKEHIQTGPIDLLKFNLSGLFFNEVFYDVRIDGLATMQVLPDHSGMNILSCWDAKWLKENQEPELDYKLVYSQGTEGIQGRLSDLKKQKNVVFHYVNPCQVMISGEIDLEPLCQVFPHMEPLKNIVFQSEANNSFHIHLNDYLINCVTNRTCHASYEMLTQIFEKPEQPIAQVSLGWGNQWVYACNVIMQKPLMRKTKLGSLAANELRCMFGSGALSAKLFGQINLGEDSGEDFQVSLVANLQEFQLKAKTKQALFSLERKDNVVGAKACTVDGKTYLQIRQVADANLYSGFFDCSLFSQLGLAENLARLGIKQALPVGDLFFNFTWPTWPQIQGSVQWIGDSIAIEPCEDKLAEVRGDFLLDFRARQILLKNFGCQAGLSQINFGQVFIYPEKSIASATLQATNLIISTDNFLAELDCKAKFIHLDEKRKYVLSDVFLHESYFRNSGVNSEKSLPQILPLLKNLNFLCSLDSRQSCRIFAPQYDFALFPKLCVLGCYDYNLLANLALEGQIKFDPSFFYLSENKICIEQGLIRFDNNNFLNSFVDLSVRSAIKYYDLQLNLVGDLHNFTINANSKPALADEEIVSLLLTGVKSNHLITSLPGFFLKNFAILLQQDFEQAGFFSRLCKNLTKPLKLVDILPYLPQTADGVLSASFDFDLGDRCNASFKKSLANKDDLTIDMQYVLFPNLSFKVNRDHEGMYTSGLEFKFKF